LLSRNETDQDALLALKAGLSLQSDSLASWEISTDFCQWIGIICSHRHKHRVSALNLSSTGLEIGQFAHVSYLDLSNNTLQGEIPLTIGQLPWLSYLDLSNNSLQGAVTFGLKNCSQLVSIKLDVNNFSGGIPDWLGGLPMLKTMSLGKNNFTGVIPPSLGNLSSLRKVYLNGNHLCGPIPEGFGTLGSLKALGLQVNYLSGTVPQTGSIPASIANATTMQSVDLSGNNFTGIVPPEIGTLCLDYLLLHKNQIKASSSSVVFTLQNNRFSGVFPSSISNLSAQLGILDIRFNEISGRIPDGIGNLPKLFKLGLSGNQFTENNQLSGAWPSSLGNLKQLQQLSLDNNSLEGLLPVNLGNLQQLIRATFSNNVLSGPLPGEIFSLSSLSYILDLSGNHFSNYLPSENLMELRLDDNSFNGSIPTSISKMHGLVLLNLTKNSLTGMIPQELGFMNGITELYLAQSYLTGRIPETMESMASLYRLDISCNHLDGQVPENGVFTNLTGFSFNGNAKLCGGIEELHLPHCPTKPMEHDQRILRVIRNAMTVISVTILACFILALLFLFSKKALRSPSAKIMIVDPPLTDDMYPRLSYSDLFRATNGFSANNLIGTGQYGSVYKGEIMLKDSVTTVAVKVFDLEQPGSSKSFLTECKVLSKICHRNLIRVITCCSCSDLNQNDFKALVLEFMFYGSLNKWLHPELHSLYHVNVLTLLQRLNIAADIAAAPDYLHNNCQPSIVHCDIKPRKILLGEDLVARVGDFGLTKILTDPLGEQSINSKSSVGILGTIGYVAPEYGEVGQISPYGDVYSFSIVLLELFTGKTPTHDMFADGLTLLKYAKMAYPARLMEIVNPLLLSVESELGQINVVMDPVIKLALSCSKNRPTERLCMRDVVDEIQTIKTIMQQNETRQSSS
ncbi:hypothetical protein SETIT_9G268400v2, partial [Setaria italica]